MKIPFRIARENNKITLFTALLAKIVRFVSAKIQKSYSHANGFDLLNCFSRTEKILTKTFASRGIRYGLPLLFVFLFFTIAESKVELSKKSDTLHVFPGIAESTTWTNRDTLIFQDVSGDAIYQAFSKNNSAYLGEDPQIEINKKNGNGGLNENGHGRGNGSQSESHRGADVPQETANDSDLNGSERLFDEANDVSESTLAPEENIDVTEIEILPDDSETENTDTESEVPESSSEEMSFKRATNQIFAFVLRVTNMFPFANEEVEEPAKVSEQDETENVETDVSPDDEDTFIEEIPVDTAIAHETDVMNTSEASTGTDESPISIDLLTVDEIETETIATTSTSVSSELSEIESHESHALTLKDFALPKLGSGQYITNVQLRLSFAALSKLSSASTTSFLDVEYRLEDVWVNAGSILIDDEVSNALNGGYFLFALPTFKDVSELETLEVRVIFNGNEEDLVGMYLDALWLEIDTEIFDKELLKDRIKPDVLTYLKHPSMHELISDRVDFMRTEAPAFSLRYESQRNAAVRFIRNLFGRELAQIESVSFLHNGMGEILLDPQIEMTEEGLWTIRLTDEDKKNLRPGRYTVQLAIDEGGKIFTDTFDFQWGMLALNPNQTEYKIGDTAELSFGALTPNGNTICNADLRLYIIDPAEYIHLVPVLPSGLCSGNNVIDKPDYIASFVPEIEGTYEMYLERIDENGEVIAHTSDTFHAIPSKSITLERNGPTRIYPPALYPMQITVTATESWSGTLIERVPSDFTIADTDADMRRVGDEYELAWDFDLMAGASKTFSYSFDAPDLSPYLYTLGPAELREEGETTVVIDPLQIENPTATSTTTEIVSKEETLVNNFVEHRMWQIASDATGNMIIFWDNASVIPSGWSCLSCGSGTFYQRFAQGGSTYNSTGGAATHTHNASGTVITSTAASTETGTGSVAPQTHQHTFTPTIGATTSLPRYRQLRVIQYTSAAGETDIPTGGIAIFDATVPSGWTRYSAQDGYYIRGENTPGTTGGSNTHIHSITGTTGNSDGTGTRNRGGEAHAGATDPHTHTATSSTAATSTEPQYIEVILGKVNATTSGGPPTGMIAMWTDTVAPGWSDISSDGSAPFNGRFMKASTTYGAVGGASTHKPSNVSGITSSIPSSETTARSGGTSGSTNTHTHQINVTNFTTVNHLPPYLTVIIGKRLGTTAVHTGLEYRWYANENAQTPSDPWPSGATNLSANEPITATTTTIKNGEEIRLRISTLITNATSTAGKAYKLQYATTSVCSSASSWSDVGAIGSGAPWRGFNNGSVTNNSAITTLVLSSSTVKQTYEENGFATSSVQIPKNGVGEWDFVLEHNGAAAGTDYCFRMIEYDGTEFDSYTRYARLRTNAAPVSPTLSKLFDNEKTSTTTPKFEFVTTDPESEELNYQIQIDDSYDFSSAIMDRNTVSHGSQFLNVIVEGDKDPFTSGQLMRFTPNTALSNGTTYYWRVRGRDPDGSNAWGDWSEIYSFTVDTSLSVSTWFQTTDEQFATNNLINMSAASDQLTLATGSTTGTTTSSAIDFDDGEFGNAWDSLSWIDTETSGDIKYVLEYLDSNSEWIRIPDSDLAGNSSGFDTSPVNLLGLDTETYNRIRIVARFTNSGGSPSLQDWTISWGYRIDTPTIAKPFANEKVSTTTPIFEFTTTDPQGDDLTYEIQWSTDNTFTSSTTRISSSSPGFENIDDSLNFDPFTSGDDIRYTIQSGDTLTNNTTYWWRVRAIDPNGEDAFSLWTSARSFTVATDTIVSTWYQTTEEQFDSNILSGTIALSDDSVSVASTASEAMLVYREGTETEPRYRIWDGDSWSTEDVLQDIGATLKWAVVRAGVTREEYVVATVGTDGDVNVQVYATGAWGDLLEVSVLTGDINSRGIDVAYETLSGRAIVAYCDGDADPSYYIWNGTSWAAGTSTINLASASNCEWIQLASDPTSDEIIILARAADGNSYEAQVWSGSSWGNSTTQGSVVEADNEGMAVAYEASGGQALIVTSDGAPDRFRWNSWSGSAWAGAATVALGGDLEWGELVSDVGSDEMALCLVDDNSDIAVVRWSGSAWTLDDDLETSGSKTEAGFSCVFENGGSRDNYTMLTYSDAAATNYQSYNNSSWSGESALNSIGDVPTMRLIRTGVNLILGLFYDVGSDAFLFSSWNGSGWSTTETLESDASYGETAPYGRPYSMTARNSGTEGTTIVSPGIDFDEGTGPYWEQMYWTDTTPGTSNILYSVQYYTASGTWEFIPDSEIPGNSAGTTTSPIDLTGLNVSTYDTIRPYAALTCDGSGNCPHILDWSVEWAGGIMVSGSADEFDQTTDVTSGTVNVAVNGTLQTGKTGTISGGTWFIDNVTAFPGDIITVFVNNPSQTSQKAVAVTRYDGFGDVTNVHLYENHLTLGSDDATTTPITNAQIGAYDVNNDTDVFFDLTGTTFTLCATAGCGEAELYVGANVVYQPLGTLYSHDIENNGTFRANANNIYISGSWDNNATATMATSSVIFSATSTSETVNSTGASSFTFNNVTFGSSTSAATWTLSSTLDVDGNLAVIQGTLARGSIAITVAGNLTTGANGSWSGTGTTTFDGSVSRTWSDAHVTPQNVGRVVVNGTSKTVTLAGNVGAQSITIGADDIFDASTSNYDVTVYENWNNQNTFVPRSGEVFFRATTTNKVIVAGGDAFYDLTFNGVGGSWAFTETNLSINNNLTIATGTITMPTGTTTISGSFTNSGGSFGHNNAGVLFNASSAKTITTSGTAFTNAFYNVSFQGSGSWSFTEAHATSSNTFRITQGTVTLPSGTLTVGGSFLNTAGTFTHNSGTIKFTSGATRSIDTNASFSNLRFTGSGAWSFVDTTVTVLGSFTVSNGTVTLPSNTLTLGGSLTNSAILAHSNGTVFFNSTDTGETINLGDSSLYNATLASQTGGWTITGNATTTHNFRLATSSQFTLQSGFVLSVGGTFTNTVGGASTTWTGSTLSLESGAYTVNTKTLGADQYATLRIKANTDIKMWNSSALSYDVNASGSLYSQDHTAVDGDLYIFGNYPRTSGTEHWSYATDFDGTTLTGGSRRQVDVRFASGGSADLTNSVLSIVGTSTATTSIRNQGSGTYTVTVTGGTTTLSRYDFGDLGTNGVSLLSGNTVTSLSDGRFEPGIGSATGLRVSSTTIDANPELQIFRVEFSTTTAISAYNVSQTDGTPSSFWWFRNTTGNLDGEAYDNDTDNPGSVRWDDSSLVIEIEGTVYQDDETSVLQGPTCGTGTPVRVVVSGGGTYNGACNGGNGTYSIPGVVIVGDPVLTVFLNDAAGGERAVAVTKTPTADITNMDLYVNRVITRHEDTEAMTIADMALYDGSDDSDIIFTAATGTSHTLLIHANNELHVFATSTFAPGGTVTILGGGTGESFDGSLHIDNAATFTGAGTTTYSVGGTFTQDAGAQFVPASTTVIMTATTSGKAITSAGTVSFNELRFTGVGGGWNINGNISATDDIYVATGTVTGTGNITLSHGSLYGNGLLSLGSGTVTIYRTNTLGGVQPWTFYGLTLGNGTVVGTTTPATNATTSVDGVLTIATGHFLDAGAWVLDLGGTGNVFVENGTFLEDTSTVRYSSPTSSNIRSTSYYNLDLNASGGSATYTGTGLGIIVGNNLTIGGQSTTTANFDTSDPALDVNGDVLIRSNGTFVGSATGAFTIAGSWDNNGIYTGSGGTVTFDASGSETIAAGGSSFSSVTINGTGALTVTEHATATGAFTITAANDFTVNTGIALAVGGTFTNNLGGADTIWTGSTLSLYGGTNYQANPKTVSDTYENLRVAINTHVRMWNSSAVSYAINATGSLYSQDHNSIDGDLYIYGRYPKSSGTDYWNYARDFDGASLSGSERKVDVFFEGGASAIYTGGGLQILGASTASTTLQNQGSGTYGIRIGGTASTSMMYYEMRNLNSAGLTFSGAPNVVTISRGDFLVSQAGGSAITVGGTVINQNPAKTFTNNIFSTSTGISAFNVTATGTSVSSWRFTNHTGTIDGEAYNVDPDGNPGYIVWDNSAANITISGNVYSDEGTTVSGVCDGGTPNIHIRVAGLTSYTTSCDAGSGLYSKNGISYSVGDSLVVYIDGESEKAAAVTEDPVSNINNMHLYENRVIVRHENTDPLSIADMALWDSSDDGDIPFTAVDAGTDTLTLPSNSKLIVWTGKEFEPHGNVTLSGGGGGAAYDGTLELFANAIFDATGSESHSIGGSFISGSGATFDDEISTFTFTTTGVSRTIDTNEGSFYNMVFNGSGSWTIANADQSVGNDFTITQGAVTLPSGTTTVTGSFQNNGGSFVQNGGQMVFNASGAESIRQNGSNFGTTTYNGAGSWTYVDTNATSTGSFHINAGTVTLPSGVLSVGGDFINEDSLTHNSGTLRLVSGNSSRVITLSGSDLSNLTIDGSGAFTLTDGSAALTGTLRILEGSMTLATNTLSVGGSFLNTGGSFAHASGTVLFNSSDTGETINPGSSTFYSVSIAAPSGGYTITEHATTTNNFSLTSATAFAISSNRILTVEGVFTNLVGGSATNWGSSTLKINSGTGYSINTKVAGGDQYNLLRIGTDTDLRMWNSAATTTVVDASGSLYSQDHLAVNGALYIYGDYRRTTGGDYWNYATDFDGTDLTGGSERGVLVRHAPFATTTVTGGTLQIRGASLATTTVTNQGSGNYSVRMLGGTIYAQNYAFRNLRDTGLTLSGTTTVTSLSNGDFELAVAGGSLVTLSSTTLNHNASLVVTGVRFATTTAITGTNIELIGTTPSAWTFTSHRGNLDGEDYDVDGGTDCGSIRWSDSTCLLTEQSAYRWRSNNGGEGIPDSEWFDQDWTKRTRITLSNADATEYTDAVVEITVPYDSDMQSDFDDLRFADASGTTTLDYFVATTTAGTSAEVWVKVPTLTASDLTTIYMYYGNGSAIDGSNGTSTFIAFDNFEDGSLSEYAGANVAEFMIDTSGAFERTRRLEASDPNNGRTTGGGMFNNSNTVSQGETIRFMQYISASATSDESCTTFATQSATLNYAVCLELYQVDRMSLVENALDNDQSGTVLGSTTVTYATGWYEVEIDWATDDSMFVSLYKDDVLIATTTGTDASHTSGGIGFTLWTYHGAWDFISSRPTLATEPTYTFGFEQVPGGASWLAAKNTKASGINAGTVVRPRFVIENTGLTVNDQYLLEFAAKGNAPSCEAVPGATYAEVPPQASCTGSPICMQTSASFSNRASTTDIIGGEGTFTYGQIVEDPDNDTVALSIDGNEYTEVEYAIVTTNDTTDSNYCLRVSDAGSDIDSYARIAELELKFSPTISSVIFNDGEDISLFAATTTRVYATGTASDLNGYTDLTEATTTIFRSGVGEACPADDNNCYIAAPSSCSFTNCSANSCDIICYADIYYYAEPTDAGTYGGETWRALLSVSDQAGDVATATAASIDLLTLRAISVNETINYGSLEVAQNTGSYNATTTVENVGNDNLDLSISGTDLSDGASSEIPVTEQIFATTTFNYTACVFCSTLSTTSTSIKVDLAKPTTISPGVTDEVFWGIEIPFGVAGTAHSGVNTFYAIGELP